MYKAKGRATSRGKKKGSNFPPHKRKKVNALFANKDKINSKPPDKGASVASNNIKEDSTAPRQWLNRLAKVWRQGLAGLAVIIEGSIVVTLMGFNPWPQSSPLMTFIDQHPIASLVIGGILLVLTFISLIVLRQPEPQISSKVWRIPRWIFSTAMPIISFTLFIMLLTVVLIRPPWCPTAICPPPQRVLITHPHGIHNDNLEIYLIASQSASYVIPGDPAHYTQDNLPMNIAALHTDGQNSMLLYHLVLGLNDLQQERFGMVIEEVDLVNQQVLPMPHPLNVWNNPSLTHYENDNQYRAVYFGQEFGAIIPAKYLRFQFGFVHLAPGEQDQIDVHIISRVEANIFFSVQVIYRIDNESQLHLLKLPQVFEVMFADKSDWRLYRFQDGHFLPNK